MKRMMAFLLAVTVTLGMTGGATWAQGGGNFNIPWSTLEAGGGASTGGSFSVTGTIGQFDAAPSTHTGGPFAVEGGFWHGAQAVLAVELESFNAECRATEQDILLSWVTASETDVLGFNLLRATSENGEQIQINGELIPSESPGGGQGANYDYVDITVAPTNTYYYWLEAIEFTGATASFGPVDEDYPCVPTAVQMDNLTASSAFPWGRVALTVGMVAVAVWLTRRTPRL